LRVQVGGLQRAMQSVSAAAGAGDREPAAPAPAIETGRAAPHTRGAGPHVGFANPVCGAGTPLPDQLRASRARFAGRDNVLDVGCGRGELLSELKAAGVHARGVDANEEMAAVARARGLDAVAGDALACLMSLPDESLGGLAATQVVEHLEPGYLL